MTVGDTYKLLIDRCSELTSSLLDQTLTWKLERVGGGRT